VVYSLTQRNKTKQLRKARPAAAERNELNFHAIQARKAVICGRM